MHTIGKEDLTGKPVALEEMLAAREARAWRQQLFLQKYHAPLLSFTLNIPGPVKTSPILQRLFAKGLDLARENFQRQKIKIIAQEETHAVTGDEALWAFCGEARDVKDLTMRIEEQYPLGRLFDFDVLTEKGVKLSRTMPRRCLLCERQAQDCARSRRHSVAELTTGIEALLQKYSAFIL